MHLFWQQDAGAETGFGLIAIYGEVFSDLRAKILQRVLCSVECYICVRYQPFSVSVAKYFIKRPIQHFFHGHTLNYRHLLVAVAENKVNTVTILIEYKLDNAVSQRHFVHNTVLLVETQRRVEFLLRRRNVKPKFDVEGLNGSFDKTEFDLASAENTTIENAPTDTTGFGISGGAITKDQKIGTITVKITSDTSDTTMVKNLEDLRGVFENGGKAKLNSDLNGAYEMLTVSSGKDLEFDLNRKTLSVESISLSNDGNETLTLRNGTIGCYVQMNGRAEQHLIVDNCTLNGLGDNNNYSDVTLRDCVIMKDCFTSYGGIWKFEGVNNITGTMKVKKDVTISGDFTLGTLKVPMVTTGTPTLKLSGNIRIGKFSFDSVYREEAKIICGVGTYNFKPDEYETGRYGGIQLAEGCTVSGPDENGIYTVTAE